MQVQQAIAGKEAAVRELVEYLTPTVQTVLNRYLPGWCARARVTDWQQGRKELYQEVMLALLAKKPPDLEGFDPDRGSLKAYVYTVASRICYGLVAKKPPLPTDALPEVLEDPAPSLQDRAAQRSTLDKLYDRLTESLSPIDLRVFELAVVRDQTAEEVAQATGLTVKNVHLRKHRVRKKAQTILVSLEGSAPGAEASA